MNTLLIIGHGKHGKDTVAQMVGDITGMSHKSSSEFACEQVIFDQLRKKYGYNSVSECMADRANHRKEWFDMITAYNSLDPARLAKELLCSHDIYVGMRSKREVDRCRYLGLFSAILWVDASKRLPKEGSDSMEISSDDADFIIENNGDRYQLWAKVFKTLNFIGKGLVNVNA